MGLEVEFKYGATAEALTRIEQTMEMPAEVTEMETTYYDTPSGSLSARHITLRRRLENGNSVCTLKAPANQGRAEFELSCPDIREALPRLCDLAGIPELPDLLQEGLVAVCGARFTRRARLVELREATVELALDQGVLLGGGKELPLCEVEVELKSGQVRDAAVYAVTLATAFGLTPEPKSKFKRAYDLAKE